MPKISRRRFLQASVLAGAGTALGSVTAVATDAVAATKPSDAAGARLGIPVYFPSRHLSTDNAAMIAAAGTVKLLAGERAPLDLNADVSLRLQNMDVEDEALRRSKVHYKL